MALAQPIFTADNLDEAMKGVGRQFGLVTAAITSKGLRYGKGTRGTRARAVVPHDQLLEEQRARRCDQDGEGCDREAR